MRGMTSSGQNSGSTALSSRARPEGSFLVTKGSRIPWVWSRYILKHRTRSANRSAVVGSHMATAHYEVVYTTRPRTRESLCGWRVGLLIAVGAIEWACVAYLEIERRYQAPPKAELAPPPPEALPPEMSFYAAPAAAATDWRRHFDSPTCTAQLRREQSLLRSARRTYGLYCKRRPLLYSPAQKLAYMKTPKAGSISIQELFQEQFPDHRWVTTQETLPDDVLVFTFTRDPIGRVIAAYAEIDVAYARKATPERRAAMNTTFHRLPSTRPEQGERRFLAFLDDLIYHRFGGDDRDHWAPTHAYPQLNFVCRQPIHFIGHLENQDSDWQKVQELVGVPAAKRTKIPHSHEGTKEECSKVHACFFKEADKNVSKTPRVLQRVCDAFGADFECLGYLRPLECAVPRLASSSGASHALLNSTQLPLPGGGPQSAPVYPVRCSTEPGSFGHFAWMVKQPEYQNTLFLFNDNVENFTTDALPTHPDPTGMRGNGDATLRPLNRHGWTQRKLAGNQLVAPLSAGIPTQIGRQGFSALTLEVKAYMDRSLIEIAQLLLLHDYDRVVFSAEVFGKGGKALINTFGVHPTVVAYIQQRLTRIVDPTSVVPAPTASTATGAQSSPPKEKGHSHTNPSQPRTGTPSSKAGG